MLSRASLLSGKFQPNLASLISRCTATTPVLAVRCPVDPNTAANRPVRQEPGKVRMGVFPEEWFTFFYKKTGVTGPYTFGVGLATYLVSKEWYVLEHEYYMGLSTLIMCIYAVKALGPKVAEYLDKEVDKYEEGWNHNRVITKKFYEDGVKHEETNQWRSEGQMLLVQAKRENVHLQLEAAYRDRLMAYYTEVKKKLDYQLAVQTIEQRVAQKHLANWVIKQVLASITPDQEKQNINTCITRLAALAKA